METRPPVDQAFETSPSVEAVEEPLEPRAEVADRILAAEGVEAEEHLLKSPHLEEGVEEVGHRRELTRPPLQYPVITGTKTQKSYKKKNWQNGMP